MEFNEYLETVVKNIISNTAIIKRVKATVVSVDTSTVTVIINSPKPYNDQTITISNKSHMIPVIGSTVWIYYWKNIADGFILPANMFGVGQFYNGNQTIEIFNDYTGTNGVNIQSGSIRTLEHIILAGANQRINIVGNRAQVSNLLVSGDSNSINAGSNSGSRPVLRSSINGNNNTTNDRFTQSHIIGSFNTLTDSTTSLVLGRMNNASHIDNCYIIGFNNGVTGGLDVASYITVFGTGAKCSSSAFASYGACAIGANPTLNDSSTAIAFGMSSPIEDHNGMKLTTAGDLNVYGSVNANQGADYAEYEEWKDGNENGEDRRGRFVMETGEFIRLADSNDDVEDVLGIVSAVPTICGDAHGMNWKGRFEKDVFGATIRQEQEFTDKEGNVKTQSAEVVSPEYKADIIYVPRSERKEFSPIAYMGKVVAVDDGSCVVDGYCKPSDNGIATLSKERTRFRVRKRIDDTHVLVRIR